MKTVSIIVTIIICFFTGYLVGLRHRPNVGIGIYFENDRLIIDGGRHQGYTFNGNTVEISLPAWIEKKLFPDDIWRNVDVRNFNFNYRNCNPNIVKLPSEPNSVIVVEGSPHTKTFEDPNK